MLVDSVLTTDVDLLDLQLAASIEFAAPQLEGYEVIELIGEGTYGAVWLARETETGVMVAIKRFRRQPDAKCCAEVEHLAKLNAVRGIVALRKVHLHAEPYCYVMEHLPGGTLADLMRREGRREFQVAWRMFKQLVEALRDVHREGTVHGDIKPDNVLLDSAGMPRLCDFGQARGRGSHGRTLGTLFYMPPEQARMEGLPDPRWDVYALGAILFELVTGKKPRFSADLSKLLTSPTSSATETRDRLEHYARHLEDNPTLEGHHGVKQIDASAVRLIDQCLKVEFDDRPADANAVWRLMEDSEHTRRSKPLFIFGGLAPAIMFMLLGAVVLLSGRWMLSRISSDWRSSTFASNSAIAQAIASSIRASYNSRIDSVAKAAKDPKVLALLQSQDNAAQTEHLKSLYAKSRGDLTRWTLHRADGVQVANYGRATEYESHDGVAAEVGVDETNIGRNFSWREFFNGEAPLEKNFDAPNPIGVAQFQKRTKRIPHATQPYWREGEHGFVIIAVSCPVASSDDATPIGTLHGLFPFKQLVGWVTDFEREQQQDKRNVVLVTKKPRSDQQFHIIYHPWLENQAEGLRTWSKRVELGEVDGDPQPFVIPTSKAAHLQQATTSSNLGKYTDPLDDQPYVGSSALVELDNGQQITVIVQQNEETAFAPLRTLKQLVYGLGGLLLVVGALFLASNTYALYWFLKNQRQGAAYV